MIPSRRDLLQLFHSNPLSPPDIVSFVSRPDEDAYVDQCLQDTKSQLKFYSREYGVPLPDVTKKEQCQLMAKSVLKHYNSIPLNDFNEEIALRQIQQSTGIELQPHQIQVAKYLVNHRGLLAVHRTGSGKTYTAILSLMLVKMKYPHLRTVVFLPATLKANFVEQMIKFGVSPLGVRFSAPTLHKTTSPISLQIEVYSFEEYIAFYKSSHTIPSFEHSFVVIDEAHHLRSDIKWSQDNQITSGQKSFCMMAAASQAFRVLLLTATPFINGYADTLNLLAIVDGVHPTRHALPSRKDYDTLAQQDQEFAEYLKCKVSFYYPDLRKTESQKDFPTQINMPLVIFPMNPYYFSKYSEIEAKIQHEKSESFYRKLRVAEIALDGEYSPKIDWVVHFIVEEAAKGRKSIVFSNWIYAGINLIRRRLDLLAATPQANDAKYVPIIGEIDQEDRKRFKDLYNAGAAKIMLISRAGSEGLDLINTRNVIILESNWNPSADFQIIGRAVRYKSHESLPEEERTVKVWRLLMRKPPQADPNGLKSIDEELYSLSYDIKLPQSKRLLRLLKQASIEENDCSSFTMTSFSSLFEAEKMQFAPRPVPVYHELEYEYIAPEVSSLVKPEELSAEEFAKLAGTDAPLEKMEQVVQRLQQQKEEAASRRIEPKLMIEDDWI